MVETWINKHIKNQDDIKSKEGMILETTDTPLIQPSTLLDSENFDFEKIQSNNFETEISHTVNTTGKIIKLLYKFLDYQNV